MRNAVVLVVCVALFFAVCHAGSYGVDVSTFTSQSQFSCLLQANLTYAIIRAFYSTGSPDPNAVPTVAAARAAGLSNVDVYMFPCYSCGNPQSQVQSLASFLSGNSVDFDTVWLDIEGPGTYWSGSTSDNQAFFNGLLSAAQSTGWNLGIYSSASQWVPIFGSGYTAGGNLPLWFANYDGEPNFNDFSPFGGWSSPTMKQFSDQGAKCGASYDINWRASGTSTGTSSSGSSSSSSGSSNSSSGSSSNSSSSSGSSNTSSSGSSSNSSSSGSSNSSSSGSSSTSSGSSSNSSSSGSSSNSSSSSGSSSTASGSSSSSSGSSSSPKKLE